MSDIYPGQLRRWTDAKGGTFIVVEPAPDHKGLRVDAWRVMSDDGLMETWGVRIISINSEPLDP